MHIIHVKEPLTNGTVDLAAGSYLLDNVNAGQLLAKYPVDCEAHSVPNPKPLSELYLARSITAPRILIIRPGGLGDLLFLAPAIRALKQVHPESHIAVACFKENSVVLEHNPDVSEIVTYPIPVEIAESFDAIVPLENTVELEENEHAVDRFMRELGLDPKAVPDDEKRCIYHMTDNERTAALAGWPVRTNDKGNVVPRLGVQVVSGERCRTYSHDLLEAACAMLHRRGWEIFFFGPPKALAIEDAERVVNVSARGLDFRHSAAVLATCDVVLAPDSSLCHLAGALDIPTVALFGPFPWKMRTAYHPKTFALQGEGPCAPCFHHGPGFPAGPCRKSGRCDVLASIKPGRIAAKVDALYKASLEIDEHRSAGKL